MEPPLASPLDWPAPAPLDVGVLLVAVVLDRFLPELPAIVHPVVWMGRLIGLLETAAPVEGRAVPLIAGGVIVALVAGLSAGAGWLAVEALGSLGRAAYLVGGAVLLKSSFSVRGLIRAADTTRRSLSDGDLDAARASLRSLVSRDAHTLPAPLVSAAAVESVAENATDSYIAPWLAFALFGIPGALAYRAVNTLDSMLGYRGRYEYLGKAAARLDDAVNYVPARLTALLLLVGGAVAGLPVRRGWRVIRADRRATASPNAGWTMSAMAGLLGVELEKSGHYRLGAGLRAPGASDIGNAIRVSSIAAILGLLVSAGLILARGAVMA